MVGVFGDEAKVPEIREEDFILSALSSMGLSSWI